MSQEIVEAVREIEREKGIESGTLVAALEDALLAAYKKTPGAARHATVELDDERRLPRLLDRAARRPRGAAARRGARARARRARAHRGGDRRAHHTLLSDDDLDIDWREVPEDQIKREDVTPENFGRIAAQTAKQVILQRIREAEREMMYDEYVDRVERGRHRHRPAGRRPQQRPRRPRQGRGAAAALRAGRRRALRAGLAHQGRHHRGALRARRARR